MEQSWIREKRKILGVSQYKMARALGVSFHELSAWETGKENPDKPSQEKVNHFFENFNHLVRNKVISLKKRRVKHSYTLSKNEISGVKFEDFVVSNPPTFYNEKLDNTSPKALALFSGIGGMTLGLIKAGYRVVGHVEIDEPVEKIYASNFPESRFLGGDIKNIPDKEVKGWKKSFGEIDLIAGGPPCQGFSLAGKRNALDPRNELYNEFARIVKILQPKTILIENVRMFLSMQSKNGGYVKDDLIEKFERAGYKLICEPINAADYGIPQSRARVIFLGIRKDLYKPHKFSFPKSTHAEINQAQLSLIDIKPHRTFRDATHDLEGLESGESSRKDKWHFAIKHPDHVIKMLKGVPEGLSAHENQNPNMRPTSGYNTTYKRLQWDKPSSTISTNFSMISGSRNVHPNNTRSLTIREAMRCQTFPDNFFLLGSLGSIRRGIGNAIPPDLAKFFAKHIKGNLLSLVA